QGQLNIGHIILVASILRPSPARAQGTFDDALVELVQIGGRFHVLGSVVEHKRRQGHRRRRNRSRVRGWRWNRGVLDRRWNGGSLGSLRGLRRFDLWLGGLRLGRFELLFLGRNADGNFLE